MRTCSLPPPSVAVLPLLLLAALAGGLAGAEREKVSAAPLEHRVDRITLPRREVSRREYELAREKVRELSNSPDGGPLVRWHGGVVKRFENQESGQVEPFVTEVHVVRIGELFAAPAR